MSIIPENIFKLFKSKEDELRDIENDFKGTTQDEMERKLLETEIENIKKKFKILLQESNDVFEIIDSDGTIKYMSEAVENVLGYKAEDRIGKKVFDYYEGKEYDKSIEIFKKSLKEPAKKLKENLVIKTKAGKEIVLEVGMRNLLDDPSIQGIVVNFRDVTHKVNAENRINYIANHDELTRLPNRLYFNKELEARCQFARETNTRFALMIIDVNGFKYINDAIGFQKSDMLIVLIAKRLKESLGDDIFICRYSGDQFAVVVSNMNSIEDYENLAERIVKLFSKSFKVDVYKLDVTVSIGISFYNESEQDADKLNRNANIALHWAKHEGRNRYKLYSPDLNIQSYKQFKLRNDLRSAVERNEFKVFYQPVVNIKNNEILAAEALLRWDHPDWGVVSADEFIYLAEETGNIIALGNFLLKEVCRDYKQWLANGLPAIKVSINISSIQFMDENFVDDIIEIIDEYELEPHFLIIEVTESILIKQMDKVVSDIKKLHSYGIQVALDDFGTGYSSLSYLSAFNIDILKIDRSFINKIDIDETSSFVTKAIVDLAKGLNIKLIAEGIENWEQLGSLKKLKCSNGQGYIYCKPISVDKFEKVLNKKKCKPKSPNNSVTKILKNRRKYFRINFTQLLEADMTIAEIKGKRVSVGNTKVLIKDFGPGGLSFISNVRLPIARDFVLKITTQLLGKKIKVYGYITWAEEAEHNLNEYGIEFLIDENDRSNLIKDLNNVQIKMKNDILFGEGSFTALSPVSYFKLLEKRVKS